MEEERIDALACFRVSDRPRSGIDGSTKDVCKQCRQEVWVSPASRKSIEDQNAVILCFQCAMSNIKEKDGTFVGFTEEQTDEVKEQLKRNVERN